MQTVNISGQIHWMGVNDRRKHLFENLWPLDRGVSYNCYLIADQKTALVDTVEMGSDSDFLGRIESVLGDKPLDYLIINHMELDHAGLIECVVRRWPAVKLIGNAKTKTVLTAYYGHFGDNFQEVKDGEELSLGYHDLKFVFTPWVHWPETMMTYDTTDKVLFSGDAFGTFGAIEGHVIDREGMIGRYEDEMRRYYSNIVGKYGNMVQRAFQKLAGIEVKAICSLHGPTWKSCAPQVMALYDRWSRYEGEKGVVVAYASMYDNTARVADRIAQELAAAGVGEIRVHDVSKTHLSHQVSDIWKFNGLVLGSCAYNGEMHPNMKRLCDELIHLNLKNRRLALFGGYSWNGGGVRCLQNFAEASGLTQVCDPVEIHGRPDEVKLAACSALAQAVAKSI